MLIQINITRGIYKYIYVTPGFSFELQLLQEEAGEVKKKPSGWEPETLRSIEHRKTEGRTATGKDNVLPRADFLSI